MVVVENAYLSKNAILDKTAILEPGTILGKTRRRSGDGREEVREREPRLGPDQ